GAGLLESLLHRAWLFDAKLEGGWLFRAGFESRRLFLLNRGLLCRGKRKHAIAAQIEDAQKPRRQRDSCPTSAHRLLLFTTLAVFRSPFLACRVNLTRIHCSRPARVKPTKPPAFPCQCPASARAGRWRWWSPGPSAPSLRRASAKSPSDLSRC